MIYEDYLSCSRIFLIINNRKITESKGLYDEKKQNCVKAETKTYKVQKPVPNTSANLCTLSVSICFQFNFLYIFRYLVFKSQRQTNGIYSLILFKCNTISRFKILVQACVILAAIFYKYCLNKVQF